MTTNKLEEKVGERQIQLEKNMKYRMKNKLDVPWESSINWRDLNAYL